jgi:hypothetical protein
MQGFGIRLRRGEFQDLAACFLTPRQLLVILSRLRNSYFLKSFKFFDLNTLNSKLYAL